MNIDTLESSKLWKRASEEIEFMRYAPTLMSICVAILKTDWDRTDPRGILHKSPSEVESFLRSFSVRNFGYDEHSIGVQKTLCQIFDAFRCAAEQRRKVKLEAV